MKTCTKCHQEKPESEYFVRDKKVGRLHMHCKLCYAIQRQKTYKAHYKKYRELYLRRAKLWREQEHAKFRKNMLAYMSGKSCLVCGESDIRVLEFDHINTAEKSFAISQAVRLGYSWQNVLAEIEKCQILCSNCHKKRTAKQFNWYKA